METLHVKSQGTGNEVGWIRRAGDTVSFSDPDTEKMFSTRRDLFGLSDAATFDVFAEGWSNGYLTVPALT